MAPLHSGHRASSDMSVVMLTVILIASAYMPNFYQLDSPRQIFVHLLERFQVPAIVTEDYLRHFEIVVVLMITSMSVFRQ